MLESKVFKVHTLSHIQKENTIWIISLATLAWLIIVEQKHKTLSRRQWANCEKKCLIFCALDLVWFKFMLFGLEIKAQSWWWNGNKGKVIVFTWCSSWWWWWWSSSGQPSRLFCAATCPWKDRREWKRPFSIAIWLIWSMPRAPADTETFRLFTPD